MVIAIAVRIMGDFFLVNAILEKLILRILLTSFLACPHNILIDSIKFYPNSHCTLLFGVYSFNFSLGHSHVSVRFALFVNLKHF
jgi:hypothetical protein